VTSLKIAQRFWNILGAEDRALIGDTLQALADADLGDVAADLCRRIFSKEQDIDRVVADDALTPFVTLTLEDLKWVANVPGWTLAMRRERAAESLALWGF
jgi:hypothetical protein